MQLKLYAFQPQGHGELSFFTIASSEDEARAAVDKHIKDTDCAWTNGWGTDYYKLTVVEVGQVIENDNS